MNAAPRPVTFSAPWGIATRVTSILFVAILVIPVVIALTNAKAPHAVVLALLLLPPLAILIAVAFMIRGYELRDQILIINRPGWTTRIPLAGLREAVINPKTLIWSIRLFGNGGAFAFTGLFWNKQIGRYRAYVTDLKRSVVLKLADRTVVISPDAPERFLAELRAERLLES